MEVYRWTKSTYCDTAACVEVAEIGDAVGVRQTEDGERVLLVSREAWRAFVAGVKDGEFDR